MQTYKRLPVAFVKGDGVQLWDTEGRRYLDFLSGIAVVSLGHSHPAVARSISEQASMLCHVSNLYYNDIQPRLAAKIDSLIGGGGRLFFLILVPKQWSVQSNWLVVMVNHTAGQNATKLFPPTARFTAAPSRP